VGTWALLQGSVAPGPTDALLVPLGLADPRKAFALAWWAIVGSTLGGLAAFAIGAFAFEEIGAPLLRLIGVGDEELAASRTLFERRGWMLVLLSTVSPLSTKMVSIASGAFGVPLPHFALALLGGRVARFLVIAMALRFAGGQIAAWIQRKLKRPVESLR
jgi:membrane protein YqaA with SNARE-associated domain